MALVSTQPLTEMSTGIVSWGGKGGRCVGLKTLPPSFADCHEIWEPEPPGALRACPEMPRDCFTYLRYRIESHRRPEFVHLSSTAGASDFGFRHGNTAPQSQCRPSDNPLPIGTRANARRWIHASRDLQAPFGCEIKS
jgi:hypothetical protein